MFGPSSKQSLYFIRRLLKIYIYQGEVSFIKTMCIQTIKKKAMIIKPKGGLREATQHTNYDFP